MRPHGGQRPPDRHRSHQQMPGTETTAVPSSCADRLAARILILEPNAEIRELFCRLVVSLGHEAVVRDDLVADDASSIDLVLLEPADHERLAFAAALHARRPELPLVCASIYPRIPAASALDPAAYLTKPVSLAQLSRALDDASAPGLGAQV